MIRTTLFIIVFLVFTVQAYGLTVNLQPTAVVAETTVTLGDIATFDEVSEFSRNLASQPVSQAPSPGQEITLQTQPIIQQLMRSVDTNLHQVQWQGAASVTISRKVTVIRSGDIVDIINQFIQENAHDLPQAKIRFIPAAQPLSFSLPAGKLTWQVIPSDPEILGSSRFSIIFSVDDRVRRNMSVRGNMEAITQVVAAKKNLPRGTILSAKDLTLAMQDIGNLRDPVFFPRKILGKKLLVSIKAGRPVTMHQVEFPPLVKKGQLVRMILQQGSLMLTATGIARNNGLADETIRVQNTQSHKIVYCRVTAPGIVEVIL